MLEFHPEKYITYNPNTGSESPQFKELEDLPPQFVSEFKKSPQGGFVRKTAESDEVKARYMALAEDERRTAAMALRNKSERQIDRIETEAERQGEIAGEAYEVGLRR
ncbi:MAG TPA: hypothetical protein PLV72_03995 [Candidatus Magasanikbacteria bacterium]|nr:hypothetical protein [Candidatus Magasanikbacteria bacterium]